METCSDLKGLLSFIRVYPGEIGLGIHTLMFLMGRRKSDEVVVFFAKLIFFHRISLFFRAVFSEEKEDTEGLFPEKKNPCFANKLYPSNV